LIRLPPFKFLTMTEFAAGYFCTPPGWTEVVFFSSFHTREVITCDVYTAMFLSYFPCHPILEVLGLTRCISPLHPHIARRFSGPTSRFGPQSQKATTVWFLYGGVRWFPPASLFDDQTARVRSVRGRVDIPCRIRPV